MLLTTEKMAVFAPIPRASVGYGHEREGWALNQHPSRMPNVL